MRPARAEAYPKARRGARRGEVPTLLAFTDPGRSGDVRALAEALPRGAGIVYRAFGAADRLETARELALIARRRGLRLLIGADAALAARAGADGVHLPERLAGEARRLRRRRPDWIISLAAHSPAALARAARLPVDAAVISPVFASRSPSAGRPLGLMRAAGLARIGAAAGLRPHALGGMGALAARRLRGLPFAGVAAVDGILDLARGRARRGRLRVGPRV